MSLEISTAHNVARLNGTKAFLDTGTNPCRLYIYTAPQPAAGAPATGTLLVPVVLAKPCGTVTDSGLTLAQADPGGDLITSSGDAAWVRWVNGEGAWAGDGTVSDEAGTGNVRVAGTAGTTLYAGGRFLLGTTSLR